MLSIDIETYSDIDLIRSGVYAYADHPSFQVMLLAYAFDENPVQVVDLMHGEPIPPQLLEALVGGDVKKAAFNAAFERVCLSKHLGMSLSPTSWHCTAVQASMLALPLSLEGVGEVLNIERKKLKEGQDLVRYFCTPCKPSKANGQRQRNLPEDALDKWASFKAYCIRDVEAEREIRNRLQAFPVPDKEQKLYGLDQEINDRGVLIDPVLVEQALRIDRRFQKEVQTRAYSLTGLDNPNSLAQIKGWLEDKGVDTDSLDKKSVKALIQETDGEVLEMLKLRLLMAKTSIRKYEAIERSVCSDGRVHGLLQFYGANRTGRWAGRLVQVQNLPANHMQKLDEARQLVRKGDYEAIEMLYPSIPGVLSELIRTAFVPKAGHRFIVTDFSAIEARVIAWLAQESWRLDVFKTHGKIYEASASAMFGVPIEEITKGSTIRQKGKVAELACGYGGSVGALKAMGALQMGVQEDELRRLIQQWRNANSNIVRFWWDCDSAAMKAVREKVPVRVGRVRFDYVSGILFITLPSGRKLAYIKPRFAPNQYGREGLTYEGIGDSRKWTRIDTYGPKLVENIVQATARDLLAEAMLRLKEVGYNIVMHCHDEVVVEAPLEFGSVDDMGSIMSAQPVWADGLPLNADGYECEFYKKE